MEEQIQKEFIKKVRAFVIKNGKIAVIHAGTSKAFMLPGGKIDEGETDKQAITREICEETGIDISIENIDKPFYIIRNKYKKEQNGKTIYKDIETSFFIIPINQDFNIQKKQLSYREKQRMSETYWINPEILEYKAIRQKNNTNSDSYAIKYAEEFLKIYSKFKEIMKEKVSKSEEFLR